MKKYYPLLLILAVVFSGCCSKKLNNTVPETSLFDNTWELEYLSGIRIAFEGLYPEKKPGIQFNKTDEYFGGNTSCNGYRGKYKINSTQIQLEPLAKTMAYCEGGGEEAFLNVLGKVNRFTIDSEGKLLLMIDDVPMMRFKKLNKPQP